MVFPTWRAPPTNTICSRDQDSYTVVTAAVEQLSGLLRSRLETCTMAGIGGRTSMVPGRERYWDDLRQQDPHEVCRRALVSCSEESSFSLYFLNREYCIYPTEERVVLVAGGQETEAADLSLLFLMYLLRAQDMPLSGTWTTEKGLPGGALFFQGPHTMPAGRLIHAFGEDVDRFVRKGKALGARKAEFGDAALELQPLPRIPMVCVLWRADEEFPARASFLFDSTAASQLPLDVILDLTHRAVERLTE